MLETLSSFGWVYYTSPPLEIQPKPVFRRRFCAISPIQFSFIFFNCINQPITQPITFEPPSWLSRGRSRQRPLLFCRRTGMMKGTEAVRCAARSAAGRDAHDAPGTEGDRHGHAGAGLLPLLSYPFPFSYFDIIDKFCPSAAGSLCLYGFDTKLYWEYLF